MSINVTRTSTAMLGTPGSPTSIGATASATVTALTMNANNGGSPGTINANIGLIVTVTTVPTTPILIQFEYSLDGTNYILDGPQISFTAPTASLSYGFRYDPPDAAQLATFTLTNGATTGITAWSQGSTLAIS